MKAGLPGTSKVGGEGRTRGQRSRWGWRVQATLRSLDFKNTESCWTVLGGE